MGVLVLAAVAGLAFYLFSRSDETARPNPTQDRDMSQNENSYALTDQEALEKFDELEGLLIRAYKERDVTLTRLFTAPDAKETMQGIDNEIEGLLRSGAIDKTTFRRVSVEVLSNQPTEVQIQEVMIIKPRFVAEKTREDVTRTGRPERRTVIYTMRRYGVDWKFYDAVIIDAEPLK